MRLWNTRKKSSMQINEKELSPGKKNKTKNRKRKLVNTEICSIVIYCHRIFISLTLMVFYGKQ